MVIFRNYVQKELFFRTLDRVQAYELVKNSWEYRSGKPLTVNEELRKATLELFISASDMIDEELVREKLEAVNSLLDKLIPAVDSGIGGLCKEIPDLVGHKRENSELAGALPYVAKNMEGSLKDLVTLLSGNSNITATEQNNRNIVKAHTCLTCSAPFTSKRKDSKYCSSRCKQIAYRERKESA
jgi:hypothetical protein